MAGACAMLLLVLTADPVDAGTLVRSFGVDVAFGDLGPPEGLKQLKGLPPAQLQQAEVLLVVDRVKTDIDTEYLREKGLSVTDAELERCIAGLKKRSAMGNLRDNAREMMVAWKANVALFHEFGGRLSPTLIGLDAVDAQRSLLLRYETKKLIVFANPKLREVVLSRFGGPAIDVSSDERSVKDFEAGPRCLH